jgi:hypothetical protein
METAAYVMCKKRTIAIPFCVAKHRKLGGSGSTQKRRLPFALSREAAAGTALWGFVTAALCFAARACVYRRRARSKSENGNQGGQAVNDAYRIAQSLIAVAATAMLAACGAPAQTIVPVDAPQVPTGAAKANEVLYVVNRGRSTEVEMLALPEGKRVGTLPTLGSPVNVCLGVSGNVWLMVYEQNGRLRLDEFPHGGTKPIATLKVPIRGANGCAVDAVSGNLAVFSNRGISGGGEILVWKGAQGKPTAYETAFEAVAGAYDNKGNLFFDGISGSDPFLFAELPRNGATTHYVRIKHAGVEYGSVIWDGSYLAVEGAFLPSRIYRLDVSKFTARVVQTIELKSVPFQAWFWTDGTILVSTKKSHDDRSIGLWSYPEGGVPSAVFKSFHNPAGLTVSRAP